MLELAVAVNEGTYAFDGEALVAARAALAGAVVDHDGGRLGELAPQVVELPVSSGRPVELAMFAAGVGLDLDAPSTEEAAEVLEWLAGWAACPSTSRSW